VTACGETYRRVGGSAGRRAFSVQRSAVQERRYIYKKSDLWNAWNFHAHTSHTLPM
jgi:hypothetical protein